MKLKYTEQQQAIIERANREKAQTIDDTIALLRRMQRVIERMSDAMPEEEARQILREHGLLE